MYLVFGVLTTLINVVSFIVLTYWGLPYLCANALAWSGSVLFAYETNRNYVFHSERKSFWLFLSSRLFTGVLDMGGMWVCVQVLGMNTDVSKILMNVVVVLVNYLLSKRVVF